METVSFVLGMCLVVVIGISVVAVMALVKVSKLRRDMINLETVIDNINDTLIRKVDSIGSKSLDVMELYRQLDSRLDKFENRVNNKKQLLND